MIVVVLVALVLDLLSVWLMICYLFCFFGVVYSDFYLYRFIVYVKGFELLYLVSCCLIYLVVVLVCLLLLCAVVEYFVAFGLLLAMNFCGLALGDLFVFVSFCLFLCLLVFAVCIVCWLFVGDFFCFRVWGRMLGYCLLL